MKWQLHIDYAVVVFKARIKDIITGRCCACGSRHIKPIHETYQNGSSSHCGYGYLRTITYLWYGTVGALLHGED